MRRPRVGQGELRPTLLGLAPQRHLLPDVVGRPTGEDLVRVRVRVRFRVRVGVRVGLANPRVGLANPNPNPDVVGRPTGEDLVE